MQGKYLFDRKDPFPLALLPHCLPDILLRNFEAALLVNSFHLREDFLCGRAVDTLGCATLRRQLGELCDSGAGSDLVIGHFEPLSLHVQGHQVVAACRPQLSDGSVEKVLERERLEYADSRAGHLNLLFREALDQHDPKGEDVGALVVALARGHDWAALITRRLKSVAFHLCES